MKREQWGSRAGFILAAVGSAVGLGNIWRFPYMTYQNGGGAFLIPYLFAMLTAGIPFMIMEFSLGSKLKGAAPRVFSKLNVKLEWLGWFQVTILAVIGLYYLAVIGWTISYFKFSFTQAWGSDPNTFFFKEYLQLDGSPSKLGAIQWHIAIPMAIAWAVTFNTVFRGVKSGIEKLSKILMPVLFVMVLFLIVRISFLDGAMNGLNFMFKPDFSKLLDPKVWAAAYGQIFYSLSIGFSIMLAYSSYLPEKSDINNNAFLTVFLNCGFSLLAGIMIFGTLGYMAAAQGKEVTDVVNSGVGLAFVTLPAVINLLPAPYILGPLFFLTLLIAGMSSHISIIEAIVASLIDKFNWTRHRAAVVVCGLGVIASMMFATNGGLFLLDVVDYFINHFGILTSCFVELIIVGWIFKISDITQYANHHSEFAIGTWFIICIRFISPLVLATIIYQDLYTTITKGYGGYEMSDLMTRGWGVIVGMLVIGILINIFTRPSSYIHSEEA